MRPVDVTSPFAGAVKLTADFATFAEQLAAPCIAVEKQMAGITASFEPIARQMARFTESVAHLAPFIRAAKPPRWQPCRSPRRSSGRTSARRTGRSGAARALSRLADEPARPAPGREAGLALALAGVGGLDTLPACWPVIA